MRGKELWNFMFAALLGVSMVTSSAAEQGPADTIKSLYAQAYGIGGNSGKSGIDEKLAPRFLDGALVKLYNQALKDGRLDADFFVQGQDFAITKPIEIDKVEIHGEKAKVSATLTQSFGSNPSDVKHFVFLLVKTKSGWRIDEAFCGGDSLTNWWKR
ncbi:hypothetical protein ACQR1H_04055 [Bradyrhizobium sp. HKCCYLRH2015]|uniref:hypothetical protein n=1 Tax=Bradyrhizobium sp. HKCCYLRH2015 TaxID=3420742 RepID=UPI003EB88ECD